MNMKIKLNNQTYINEKGTLNFDICLDIENDRITVYPHTDLNNTADLIADDFNKFKQSVINRLVLFNALSDNTRAELTTQFNNKIFQFEAKPTAGKNSPMLGK